MSCSKMGKSARSLRASSLGAALTAIGPMVLPTVGLFAPSRFSASMLTVRIRPLLPVAVGLVLLLAGAGCGSKKSSSAAKQISASGSPGEKIFLSAGCSGCHTLAVADAKGKIGPNLDELRPNQQRIELQLRNGGRGMPSFKNKLSAAQIQQVAGFVATTAGTGSAGKISFQPNDKTVESCSTGDSGCYEQAFGNLAYKDGPKAALDKLAEL